MRCQENLISPLLAELFTADAVTWLSSAGATYLLIALAEFGDKSQLVCMTLAARHRGMPVVVGAVAAFAVLNLLAVLFGAAVAAWLPAWAVTAADFNTLEASLCSTASACSRRSAVT